MILLGVEAWAGSANARGSRPPGATLVETNVTCGSAHHAPATQRCNSRRPEHRHARRLGDQRAERLRGLGWDGVAEVAREQIEVGRIDGAVVVEIAVEPACA